MRSLFWMLLLLALVNVSVYGGELYLLYDKSTYKLTLRRGQEILVEFTAGHGLRSPLPKRKRGDMVTPEGLYWITDIRPSQQYYYFIEISYPNWNDFSWAYFRQELSWSELVNREGRKLGYAIGIHGGGAFKKERGIFNFNWTQGCIALDNEDLKKLLRLVRPGIRVYIVDSQKSFFDILKKFAYPLQVRPLDFWEGALYLMVEEETFWYFHLKSYKNGKRYLLWEEWRRGYLTRREESAGEGRFSQDLENELRATFIDKIYNILDPVERKDLETWK